MNYAYCGNSGLLLPRISLGLWHNFGFINDFAEAEKMIIHAYDNGVFHFDLANNYGPPPGSAETNFGKILKSNLSAHRDKIIVSSKAGHLMWNGPYGDGSSRKHIMASIDQSLLRTGLEYFDIFYSHRYDSNTPIEETMQALVDIVKQGKALYIGLSKYPPAEAEKAIAYLNRKDVPCLIFQDRYSMLNRQPEKEILPLMKKNGIGFIGFSPLAQGMLTDKYIDGIPVESRAADKTGFLKKEQITVEVTHKVKQLSELAKERGQTMAELALSWALRHDSVTSLIVGARNLDQLKANINSLHNPTFAEEELSIIDNILNSQQV